MGERSPHSLSQILDALLELRERQPAEAQAHEVVELVLVHGHALAAAPGHLPLGLHPHEVAALGLHGLQANLPELLAHQRATAAQVLRHHVDVLREGARLHEVNQVARGEDHGVVAAIDETHVGEGLQQRLVGVDPAHLDAGPDQLREGADAEHARVLLVVVVEQGLDAAVLKVQQLVRLVGNDHEPVLLRQGDEPLPLGVGHADARGVVVHRHGVHHLDLARVLLQQLLQGVHVHAIGLHRHAQQAHAAVLDHGEGEVVRRLLHDGDVAGLAVDARSDIGAHGGAARRHQGLPVHGRLVLLLQERGQGLAEARVPQHVCTVLRVAIIQRLLRDLQPLLEALGQGLAQLRLTQQLRVRPALDEVLSLRHGYGGGKRCLAWRVRSRQKY
mmetsp:Transcript_33575/g.85918  ORF Transcript_33575/g.85918 Transcript_33575/m.85918 type:complete len:388 (+) Transcript_33575:246-1409(+)